MLLGAIVIKSPDSDTRSIPQKVYEHLAWHGSEQGESFSQHIILLAHWILTRGSGTGISCEQELHPRKHMKVESVAESYGCPTTSALQGSVQCRTTPGSTWQ